MQENCAGKECPVKNGIKKICMIGGKIHRWLDYGSCPVKLAIRLVLADVFWKSGNAKIATWDSTLYLFANEYNVPLIPPHLAAYLATAVELGGAALLFFGLGTRIAALALLFLSGVIEFTYMHNDEHIYWGLLLLVLVTSGAGNISLDWLITRKCRSTGESCGIK